MKRIILFSGIFLIAGIVFAQNTINADKNFVSSAESNVVEITAAAIPFNQKENFKIAPEKFHKIENIQNSESENNTTIEITVEAKKYDDQNNLFVKKETIEVSKSGEIVSSKQKQKQVEIKATAVKQ